MLSAADSNKEGPQEPNLFVSVGSQYESSTKSVACQTSIAIASTSFNDDAELFFETTPFTADSDGSYSGNSEDNADKSDLAYEFDKTHLLDSSKFVSFIL